MHPIDVRALVKMPVDPKEYDAIRAEWTRHSIAEDARDIPGLVATLAPDCVYEVPQRGRRWEGHEGATRFYEELLAAFPDVHFALTNIVIGPQGVYEEALATGTHKKEWLGFAPSGGHVEFRVIIHFPWDPDCKKFRGERVFFDLGQSA